ncbi:flagellar basal body rod protein FlgG [Oceanobacillus luteolus]|uniref:flagellar basal body rod protein FlgG n=1 Tax=Oceanobacillus luteolus TaxID=1274358 RepID=UPI0020425A37|nr:flagellar basal body rod protein FlgG [Oceanobacillus luteolus]MCM3739041.1 flagellar basal body rod protein FlgG [Oceanobacillus luteolus]
MLRSMYAGISGMKNFQTKLDVIGNNIANVSTVGFKKGQVTFQEMMSQTASGAQGSTGARGGVNASQIGLGAQLGTINNIHTQGFRQTTNNPLDLSIQGDGMFEVVLVETPNGEGNTFVPINFDAAGGGNAAQVEDRFYTRAGNFYLDDRGFIVNSEGMYLVGFEYVDGNPVDSNAPGVLRIPLDAQSFNISTNGTVNYIDANGENQVAGQIGLANFANPTGLTKEGNNLYRESQNSGGVERVLPEESTSSQIISNSLEMSNVDLAEEFTEMISAQRGFQANSRIITTSDEILQELVNLKR